MDCNTSPQHIQGVGEMDTEARLFHVQSWSIRIVQGSKNLISLIQTLLHFASAFSFIYKEPAHISANLSPAWVIPTNKRWSMDSPRNLSRSGRTQTLRNLSSLQKTAPCLVHVCIVFLDMCNFLVEKEVRGEDQTAALIMVDNWQIIVYLDPRLSHHDMHRRVITTDGLSLVPTKEISQ